MLNIKEFTIKNGLRVIYARTNQGVIASQLHVNHGWYHEQAGEEGLAHLLEHVICDSGSTKYNPVQTQTIFERFGYTNAITNLKTIAHLGTYLPEQLSAWLDITGATFFDLQISEDVLNTERDAVLNEIGERRSGLFLQHQWELCKLLSNDPKTTHDGLGNPDIIKNATVEQLMKYHKRGFNPTNATLFMLGAIPRNIKALVQQNLSCYKPGNAQTTTFEKSTPFKTTQIIELNAPYLINHTNPQDSLAHYQLHYRLPEVPIDDQPALTLASYILGESGQKSILFKHVREKYHLSYNPSCDLTLEDTGNMLTVSLQLQPKHLENVSEKIFEAITTLQESALPPVAIDNINQQLRYLIAVNASSEISQMNALHKYQQIGLNLEEIYKRLQQVSASDILRVANKYFPTEKSPCLIYIKNPKEDQD